jgi:hypothetical protein
MVASKYDDARRAFDAAMVKLHIPGTTWPQYAAAVEESDSAWRALVNAANPLREEH